VKYLQGILKDYLELPKSREERDVGRGCLSPQDRGSGGITPGKILKVKTEFDAI